VTDVRDWVEERAEAAADLCDRAGDACLALAASSAAALIAAPGLLVRRARDARRVDVRPEPEEPAREQAKPAAPEPERGQGRCHIDTEEWRPDREMYVPLRRPEPLRTPPLARDMHRLDDPPEEHGLTMFMPPAGTFILEHRRVGEAGPNCVPELLVEDSWRRRPTKSEPRSIRFIVAYRVPLDHPEAFDLAERATQLMKSDIPIGYAVWTHRGGRPRLLCPSPANMLYAAREGIERVKLRLDATTYVVPVPFDPTP